MGWMPHGVPENFLVFSFAMNFVLRTSWTLWTTRNDTLNIIEPNLVFEKPDEIYPKHSSTRLRNGPPDARSSKAAWLISTLLKFAVPWWGGGEAQGHHGMMYIDICYIYLYNIMNIKFMYICKTNTQYFIHDWFVIQMHLIYIYVYIWDVHVIWYYI